MDIFVQKDSTCFPYRLKLNHHNIIYGPCAYGHEYMFDILPVGPSISELPQNTNSTAAIDQEILSTLMENKASIIAILHDGVSCFQQGQFIMVPIHSC